MNNDGNTYSKEKIVSEIARCSIDYNYALKEYGHIVIPGHGIQPFSMFDYQETCINAFQREQDIILLKSRQLGITTVVAGFIAVEMCLKDNYEALVIATKKSKAITAIRKVKTVIKNMPTGLMSNIKIDNAMSLELENGSIIKAVPSTDDAGRSDSLSILVIDEAAGIKKAKDIGTGASETLSTTGGKAIILSTPNGIGNGYHKTGLGAKNNENGFFPLRLDGGVHPNRDEHWKQERIKKLGELGFSQEHGCSFLSSGNTVIPGQAIKQLEEATIDPIKKLGPKKDLGIWEFPKTTSKYLISADVAIGDDGDYSAAHIIDVEQVKQVAEYRGYLPPGEFGHMLIALGQQYNNALLAIENNGLGLAAVQVALDNNYRNLFWSKKGSLDFIDPNTHSRELLNDKHARPGFNTNRQTRPLIIQKGEDYIREDAITIYSRRLIDEMYTFTGQRGKAIAEPDYHDDLILALCIGLWIRDTALKLYNIGVDFDRQRVDGTKYVPESDKSNRDLVYTQTNIANSSYNLDINGKEQGTLEELLN